jgi:hypothetical protein
MDTMLGTHEKVCTDALGEVLDEIVSLVVTTAVDNCIPVHSITEVRGWVSQPRNPVSIIDMRVDGLWTAFGL